MKTSPAYNLISGQTLLLEPPDDIPYAGVALYNGNNLLVNVNIAGNTDVLQPYQAKLYPMPSPNSVPQLMPQTSAPPSFQFYMGTIYGVFYLADEMPAPGFPLPLTAFPGGEQLQAVLLGPPTAGQVYIISPPTGTGQLTVQQTDPYVSWTLTGYQSGVSYGTPIQSNGLVTWNFIAAAGSGEGLDVQFILVRGSAAGGNENVFVAPSIPIPSQPNQALFTSPAGSWTEVINPPNYGGIYLFGIDYQGTSIVDIGSASGTPIATLAGNTSTAVADHILMDGYRLPSGLWVQAAAAGGDLYVRYAIGP